MVALSLGVIGIIEPLHHFTHGLSRGFPFQILFVTVVQEAVENRVCQGRIVDGFEPLTDRQLAGDQCGTPAMAVFHDLQ